MRRITCAIAGLGNRGNDIYGHYEFVRPEEMKVVAIAEPMKEKRECAKKTYQLDDSHCFETAEDLLSQPQLADVIVIATQDRQHVEQAVKALSLGYHVLCEKPISPSAEECRRLQKAAHEYRRIVAVGHVLRYTPFYSKVKELIDSGRIGDIVSIQAMEHVTYWHQAHSYVRGNWRDSDETSPMILAKSCHDCDIFSWLIGKECKRVSSFGSLSHFRKEQAPEGATLRCLEDGKTGDDAWPVCILSPNDLSEEAIYHALETGPYGRCVYYCDNNVVDHQVVNMEFEDGITVDFQMCAFTGHGGRTIHVCGTKGDIYGNLGESKVMIEEFGENPETFDVKEGDMSGHAGGDNRLIHDFLVAVEKGADEEALRTGIDVSIQSHLIALAAEQSRLAGGIPVKLDEVR